MRTPITKAEFISELLKDDLDSGKKSHLIPHRAIVNNPNLLFEEENNIRLSLVKDNGAFGMFFEYYPDMSFYKENINQDDFLKLLWCPKGSPEEDGIDIMTGETRFFKDILEYLKSNSLNHKPKVTETLKDYFSGILPSEDKKKLFLEESGKNRFTRDGNHRAGAILKTLSNDINHPIFPVTIYVASLNETNNFS